MKKLFTLLLVLTCQLSLAQHVELVGKVDYYSLGETGKIYYTKDGEKFDHKKFVTYDKDRNYTFKMSIREILKNKIGVLAFAADTSQKTNLPYACIQKINLGAIVSSPDFKNLKTIKLNTDLVLGLQCEESIYWDAAMEGMKRHVGSYSLTVQDTSRLIQLENVFFKYKSGIHPMTKDYMNEEQGSWNFNEEKKQLSFFIHRQVNSTYGLILRKRIRYDFIMTETPEGIAFESKAGVLTRN
jgi:hypothetical protein